VHLFYTAFFNVLIVVNLYYLMGINEFFISHFVDYNSVSVTVKPKMHTIIIGFNNLFSSFFFEMGPSACPETSVRNYHFLLRNNPEERSSFMCYVVVCKVKNAVYKVILCLISVIFFNRGEKFAGK
jgi:hypothetical protein